ncbi:MAG: hypothetical protein J5663_05095 [Bacteroidaceae bacterium]|nr:hypothetical protein [Bacteroidaceae bacterium]
MIQINAAEGAVVNVTDKPINNVVVMGDMVQTKTVTVLPSGEVRTEVETEPKAPSSEDVPSPLRTEEAMHLWQVAREHGWVDDNLQPLVSQNKAAILASVMADVLRLSPRWRYFEELWGNHDWANKLSAAQNCKYYPDTLKEYAEYLK